MSSSASAKATPSSGGKAKPPVAVKAPASIMEQAREYCANRPGTSPELAASFRRGEQDKGWAVRHVVDRLRAEQAHG
jgi:hypothetical protein